MAGDGGERVRGEDEAAAREAAVVVEEEAGEGVVRRREGEGWVGSWRHFSFFFLGGRGDDERLNVVVAQNGLLSRFI